MTDPVVMSPARPSAGVLAGDFAIRVVLATAMWLGLWVGVPMVALGWQPVAIAGNSMQPNLRPGDALLMDPGASSRRLEVGTIVTYRRALDDKVVTHRIVEVRDDGRYVTKGDANQAADSDPVAPGQVVGAARLVVPMIANLAVRDSVAVPAMAITALLAALVRPRLPRLPRLRRQRRQRQLPRPPVPAATTPLVVVADVWTAHGPRRRSHRTRIVAMVLLLASVQLLAVPAPVAQATFRATTGNSASQWQAGVIENPTGLTVTFQHVLCTLRQMNLSWTLSSDPDVTSQQIYKTTGAGARTLLATKTAAATTHTDTSVSCGVTYVYEVVAVAAYTSTTWTSAVVDGQNKKSITT